MQVLRVGRASTDGRRRFSDELGKLFDEDDARGGRHFGNEQNHALDAPFKRLLLDGFAAGQRLVAASGSDRATSGGVVASNIKILAATAGEA